MTRRAVPKPEAGGPNLPSGLLKSQAGDDPLKVLGDRVRQARARRGMTRKILARDSGVSERYLAQLEAGRGNISILLLRRIGRGRGIPPGTVVLDGPVPSVELAHTTEFLRRLRPDEIHRAHELLLQKFGGVDQDA